jgi:hypothetical protein
LKKYYIIFTLIAIGVSNSSHCQIISYSETLTLPDKNVHLELQKNLLKKSYSLNRDNFSFEYSVDSVLLEYNVHSTIKVDYHNTKLINQLYNAKQKIDARVISIGKASVELEKIQKLLFKVESIELHVKNKVPWPKYKNGNVQLTNAIKSRMPLCCDYIQWHDDFLNLLKVNLNPNLATNLKLKIPFIANPIIINPLLNNQNERIMEMFDSNFIGNLNQAYRNTGGFSQTINDIDTKEYKLKRTISYNLISDSLINHYPQIISNLSSLKSTLKSNEQDFLNYKNDSENLYLPIVNDFKKIYTSYTTFLKSKILLIENKILDLEEQFRLKNIELTELNNKLTESSIKYQINQSDILFTEESTANIQNEIEVLGDKILERYNSVDHLNGLRNELVKNCENEISDTNCINNPEELKSIQLKLDKEVNELDRMQATKNLFFEELEILYKRIEKLQIINEELFGSYFNQKNDLEKKLYNLRSFQEKIYSKIKYENDYLKLYKKYNYRFKDQNANIFDNILNEIKIQTNIDPRLIRKILNQNINDWQKQILDDNEIND